MGNLKIVRTIDYYTTRRIEIERAIAEVELWLLNNLKHPDFIVTTQKRMSLLVDHEQVTTIINNIRMSLPAHGTNDGTKSTGKFIIQ